MKLTNIRPSSLRGIPRDWGDIFVGQRGAIIFGGNGTGKSSIIDAVEIVVAGESSLYQDNQHGVSWDHASPHVLHGAPQATCVVEDDSGEQYEIALNDEVPPPARTWVASARLSRFVLRRHMLLHFIVARPAQRYQALSAFLDLSEYGIVETELNKIANAISASIIERNTAILVSEQKLRTVFHLGLGDAIDPEDLAKKVQKAAADLGIASDKEIDIDHLANKAKEELTNERVSKELQQLAGLRGSAARLILPNALVPQITETSAACEALERIRYDDIQLHLVAIINASLSLLNQFAIESCPVCEAEIDREQLTESLRSRLTASQELIQAKHRLQTMHMALRQAIRPISLEYQRFIEDSGSLADRDEWAPYVSGRDTLIAIERQLQAVPTTETLLAISTSVQNLVASHDEILGAIDSLIGEIGSTERWEAIRNLSTQADLCVSEGRVLRQSKSAIVSMTRQSRIANAVATHASESRKQAIAEILGDVTATANEYYEAIHPGEEISRSQLQVRSATDASIRLICAFAGFEENPLLHFSESHLDTLGLCYFLAIRRRQADSHSDFKLLVLDDVMHSVDADHRRRVVTLLRNYFSDHQIIITTHDSVLYRILCQAFRRNEMAQHRIGGWSLERGPILADASTDIDRITVREVREVKSAEELAAAAGRFLENHLKRLTEGLQINVRARFATNHMIGDLWPPLRAKLDRQRAFSDAHGDLTARIDGSVWMRNEVGAHDNEHAAPPTEAEVREFAVLLSDLYSATCCADCSQYLTRNDNRSWSCSCGGLTYERG